MLRACTAALFMLVTGCAATAPVAICPAIVEYDAQTQSQAADELDALPAGSVLPRFMQDYRDLRAKLRACK